MLAWRARRLGLRVFGLMQRLDACAVPAPGTAVLTPNSAIHAGHICSRGHEQASGILPGVCTGTHGVTIRAGPRTGTGRARRRTILTRWVHTHLLYVCCGLSGVGGRATNQDSRDPLHPSRLCPARRSLACSLGSSSRTRRVPAAAPSPSPFPCTRQCPEGRACCDKTLYILRNGKKWLLDDWEVRRAASLCMLLRMGARMRLRVCG